MRKTRKLTLAIQQLILNSIIDRATEKSRGTFYTKLVELVQVPLCYKCLRSLKVGQYICSNSGGTNIRKYYHEICERSLWQ